VDSSRQQTVAGICFPSLLSKLTIIVQKSKILCTTLIIQPIPPLFITPYKNLKKKRKENGTYLIRLLNTHQT
jgi:hypothetical protein